LNLWEELKFEVSICDRCRLSQNRTNPVLGEGNTKTLLMFVGEAPGKEEDENGRPFLGKAGQLLTKIFNSVQLEREEVYITNVVKCRPPRNRNPEEDELEACNRYLETQIALINPKLIVPVGAVASKYFLKEKMQDGISAVRGKIFDWDGGIKIIPIFHPSYLLRNTSTKEGSPKWLTWQDMQNIKEMYENLKEAD